MSAPTVHNERVRAWAAIEALHRRNADLSNALQAIDMEAFQAITPERGYSRTHHVLNVVRTADNWRHGAATGDELIEAVDALADYVPAWQAEMQAARERTAEARKKRRRA